MLEDYYDVTHEMLIRDDSFYRHFWSRLSDERRAGIVTLWRQFCYFANSNAASMKVLNANFEQKTRPYFVRVQEKEFEYSKVRDDWYYFVRDDGNLRRLYAESFKRIGYFVEDTATALYGGIKPTSSIQRKIIYGEDGRKDQKIRPQALDIWDAVRFRVVFDNLTLLRDVSLSFWENFIDDIVRCRNYYYRPKESTDPYRAIHFELADALGRIVEVQMMTKNREAITLVDHAFIFKAYIEFCSDTHRDWLNNCSIAANLQDARNAELL